MKFSSPKKLSTLVLILWALAALLVFDLGSSLTNGVLSLREATGSHLDTPVPQPLDQSLSPKQRMVLQGDISQETPVEQWRALHEFEPNNPVYYAHYLSHLDQLPENYNATVTKIDPENGWFLHLEAAQKIKEVIEKGEKLDHKEKHRLEAEGLPLLPQKWIITNPESVSDRLALLEKAVSLSKWDSYQDEISEERFDALPEAYNVLSGLKNMKVIGDAYSPSFTWKNIAELTSAALQNVTTKEEFLTLETLILKLEKRSFESIETFLDGLFHQALLRVNSANLYRAAETVGLESKAQLYQKQELIQHERQEKLKNRNTNDTQKLIARRGSIFSWLASPVFARAVENPPQITKSMLKPGLRAERAVFSRGFYGIIFMVLSVGALLTWIHKRKKGNPARFQPEFSTLGLGVFLPFVALIFFRYFLSFGMLDYSGKMMSFGNYLLPEITTLLILLASPICLLRSQNYPKASRLKICWPLVTLVISLFLSAAMIPLHDLGLSQELVISFPLTLMLVAIFGLIFPRLKNDEPLFDLTSRLAPTYLFSATLSGFFIIGLQIEERHWFAQERFMKPCPKGFTVMESQVADILKEELRKLQAEIR